MSSTGPAAGRFTEDYYAVLGVASDASEEEIRRAARTRQRDTHPDLGGETEEFVRVRLAIEVLGDPALRAQHDAWLASRRRSERGRRRRPQRAADVPARSSPGPAGAARPPGTFVPRDEPPPPERLPKVDTDVRRTAWYRRAWPEAPEQWPPQAATLPPLRGAGLWWTAVHALVLLAAVLLLTLPASAVHFAWWPLVVVYAGFGASWLVCRILVRARLFARATHLATTLAAVIATVVTAALAGLSAVTDGPDPLLLLGQAGVYALYATTGFAAWRALAERARRVARQRLLVGLAADSAPDARDGQRVWGSAGQTAMSAEGVYAGMNPMRAALAQRVSGAALEQLLHIPGVRIVHGLRVPGGGAGSIAHAVIAGRRIAFIDAELWAPGTYGVAGDGMITRDGHALPTSATEFPHAVERFHRLFGELAQVRGWITILPDADGALEVDTARSWQRVRLTTLPDALREVGDWLAEEGALVDRLLLRDLIRHRL